MRLWGERLSFSASGRCASREIEKTQKVSEIENRDFDGNAKRGASMARTT